MEELNKLRKLAMEEEARDVERLLPAYRQYLRTHKGYHADRWRMTGWFHNWLAHNAKHLSFNKYQLHSLLALLDDKLGRTK